MRQSGRVVDRPLTLMAVHAHPDDEAASTGGVLHKYAGEAIRTVLVTCTGGSWETAAGDSNPTSPAMNRRP